MKPFNFFIYFFISFVVMSNAQTSEAVLDRQEFTPVHFSNDLHTADSIGGEMPPCAVPAVTESGQPRLSTTGEQLYDFSSCAINYKRKQEEKMNPGSLDVAPNYEEFENNNTVDLNKADTPDNIETGRTKYENSDTKEKIRKYRKNKPINPGSTNNGSPGLGNPGTGNQPRLDLVPRRDIVPGRDIGFGPGVTNPGDKLTTVPDKFGVRGGIDPKAGEKSIFKLPNKVEFLKMNQSKQTEQITKAKQLLNQHRRQFSNARTPAERIRASKLLQSTQRTIEAFKNMMK